VKQGKSTRRSASSRKGFKRILVAVDDSKSSRQALETAARLAEKNNAELIVTSVVQSSTYLYPPDPIAAAPTPGITTPMLPVPLFNREASKAAAKLVEKAVPRSKAKAAHLKIRRKVLKTETSVAKSITQYAANQRADLIVVGTSSVGSLKRLVLGSVSSGVVNNATTSVLVVR